MPFKHWTEGTVTVLYWKRQTVISLVIRQCDNPAAGTRTRLLSHPPLPKSPLPSPHLLKEGADRSRVVNRRMDTVGPRSLTLAQDSITPARLVGVYRCGGRAIHPVIPRAVRQEGRGWVWRGGGGFTWDHCTLYAWRMWDASACFPLTHTQTGLSQDQSDIQRWWGGHLSRCLAGACLAGEARKAMALFSCKKLKNLPLVQWWRWGGLEGGEMRGWINKSAINHFLSAFVN